MTPTLQILVALCFVASGTFSQVIGDTFSLPKSTVSRILTDVTLVLTEPAKCHSKNYTFIFIYSRLYSRLFFATLFATLFRDFFCDFFLRLFSRLFFATLFATFFATFFATLFATFFRDFFRDFRSTHCGLRAPKHMENRWS